MASFDEIVDVTKSHDGLLFGHWSDAGAYMGGLMAHGQGSTFVMVGSEFTGGDSFSLAVDSCDSRRIYMVHEDYYWNRLSSEIFTTQDGGISWRARVAFPVPYFCGSIALGPKAIYCPTTARGITRSTDLGNSWKEIGGPSEGLGGIDSRFITALNDNIVLAVDSEGSIWRTFNSGGDPLPSASRSGTLSAFSLKYTSGLCDSTLSQSVRIHTCYCGTANILSQRIVGKDSSSFTLTHQAPTNPDCDDTISVAFVSDTNRTYDAQLEIAQGDGETLRVPLHASPQQVDFVAQVLSIEYDTIGGTFWVSFGMTVSKPVTSVDLMLHYDPSWLSYQGSVIPSGKSIDVNGSNFPGRAALHISGSDIGILPEILFYARFAVYPSSATHGQSWIDSVRYQIEGGQCDFFWNDTIPFGILAPQNCGTDILSTLMRSGVVAFEIVPNPAGNKVTLSCSSDPGNMEAVVSDEFGRELARKFVHPRPEAPAPIDISHLPRGAYFIRLEYAGGNRALRFVKVE